MKYYRNFLSFPVYFYTWSMLTVSQYCPHIHPTITYEMVYFLWMFRFDRIGYLETPERLAAH